MKVQYEFAFNTERQKTYPNIDMIEARMGYAINETLLLEMAQVLACPVKVNPPNWQHGRVLYSVARSFFARAPKNSYNVLDIGTAKGFSALCLRVAACDAGAEAKITSLDVIDPEARIKRNTVAECDGLKTLRETIGPMLWGIHGKKIKFEFAKSVNWLMMHPDRLHFVFVDGKHQYQTVSQEIELLSLRQDSGDLIIFDDVQIDGVARAISEAVDYDIEYLEAKEDRKYAIATRR